MINIVIELYLLIVIAYTLYALFDVAKKARGGIIGKGLTYIASGFIILALQIILHPLNEYWQISINQIIGNEPANLVLRLSLAVSFMLFSLGARELEKITSIK